MKSLNDEQLDRMLDCWVAPPAPHSIESRVFAPHIPWWKRFFSKISPGIASPTGRRRIRKKKGTV